MLLKTKRIDKSIARLRKFLKKNPKRPAPETIHKIRTSARRVESSLDAMDVGKKKLHKHLVRSLSTLQKRLGKVRDMDVLTNRLWDVDRIQSI
jgi:CHAD domain-containing protein